MANLRMLGLAAALLLVPLGYATVPDAIDVWGEASAIVSDVELVRPPDRRIYDDASFREQEQLVEGHTVFAVIELEAQRIPGEEGNITIDGSVDCDHHVEGGYTWIGPIPVPSSVREAYVECQVGERVVVTPDPFTGDPGSLGDAGGPVPLASFSPTGALVFFTTPAGEPAYAEELRVTYAREGPRGEPERETYYAWATPVLHPWTTPAGKTKNFMLPMPLDRVVENGVQGYRVVPEGDL